MEVGLSDYTGQQWGWIREVGLIIYRSTGGWIREVDLIIYRSTVWLD